MSASASGNGRVVASRTGTRRAAVECAVAVAEELAARQVVPFLRQLAATRYRAAGRATRSRAAQAMVAPPSTTMVWPVTNDAASESR